MAQVARATLNILNLHPVVSMHALLVGLRSGKFLDTLYAKLPKDMDQIWARAIRYMIIEENAEDRRRAIEAPTSAAFIDIKRKRSEKFENYTP